MWKILCRIGLHRGPNTPLGRGWHLGWGDRYYMQYYRCESCGRTHMERVTDELRS